MASKRFIYINNSGLVIYAWHGRELHEELRLKSADNAQQLIEDYLMQHGNPPIRVFIDILEEMYSLESMPHLNPRDRKAMVQRKLKQLFPRLQFTYSEYKGRDDGPRRDDLMFFSAISDDEVIQRWLQVLFKAKVNVSGLFSLPVLLEGFAEKLQGDADKLIISLVATHKGVLLRQSFFHKNVLALSRFKQINVDSWQQLAEEIKEDVNRSQRFVSRHFSLAPGSRLPSYFFTAGTADGELFKKIDFTSINLQPASIACKEFAASQGDHVSDECGLAVYVAGLNARKAQLKSHYKDTSSAFYYQHYLISHALNISSACIFLIGLSFAAYSFMDAGRMYEQMDGLRVQRSHTLQELAKTQSIPMFKGFDPFQLSEQLDVKKTIKQHRLFPQRILETVSQALQKNPQVALLKLEWGGKDDSQDDGMGQVQAMDPNMMDESGMMPDSVDAGGEKATIALLIEGKIEDFAGNYRLALASIERFRQDLENSQRIASVQASSLPVDLSSGNELSGAINNSEKKDKFTLQLKWVRHGS